jgi:N-acetylmuramoyl-L-alanine amidase
MAETDDTLTVFTKTVFAEARGESEEGQRWVAWVIKNRAEMNKEYWCGRRIRDVCLCKYKGHVQFECWNNPSDIEKDIKKEPEVYKRIHELTKKIFYGLDGKDPTGGADHYHNPKKEGHKSWVDNCEFVKKIGNHVFYKSRNP